MITLKINLSKIEKEKLYKGEKGIYLDLVMFETPNNEFNDYIIKQSITKEEREQGKEMPICGGGKNYNPELSEKEKSDLPF